MDAIRSGPDVQGIRRLFQNVGEPFETVARSVEIGRVLPGFNRQHRHRAEKDRGDGEGACQRPAAKRDRYPEAPTREYHVFFRALHGSDPIPAAAGQKQAATCSGERAFVCEPDGSRAA
jgi:hypothetical protein